MTDQADTLFDDIPRDQSGVVSTYSDRLSTFRYLNRAAGNQETQARELLESWFTKYPEEHKHRLRKNFRSELNGQHVGAWWELYTYTLYRQMGYSVTVEPELPDTQKTIDFLVSRDGEDFYVECVVDGADEGPLTSNPAIEALIYDSINRVRNRDFLVGIEIEGEGADTPNQATITDALEQWLGSLDPDRVTEEVALAQASGELGVLPERSFSFRGWDLKCVAFPSPPSRRQAGGRLLGYRSSNPVWLNNVERIRDAVRKKANKYGRHVAPLDTPLVVAILSVAGSAEQADVTDAMFGIKAVQFRREDPRSVEVARLRDGYWRGPPSPQGTKLSGVLFSHDVRPWSVTSHLPSLWFNPWAVNPLAEQPSLASITVAKDGTVNEQDGTATPQGVFGL